MTFVDDLIAGERFVEPQGGDWMPVWIYRRILREGARWELLRGVSPPRDDEVANRDHHSFLSDMRQQLREHHVEITPYMLLMSWLQLRRCPISERERVRLLSDDYVSRPLFFRDEWDWKLDNLFRIGYADPNCPEWKDGDPLPAYVGAPSREEMRRRSTIFGLTDLQYPTADDVDPRRLGQVGWGGRIVQRTPGMQWAAGVDTNAQGAADRVPVTQAPMGRQPSVVAPFIIDDDEFDGDLDDYSAQPLAQAARSLFGGNAPAGLPTYGIPLGGQQPAAARNPNPNPSAPLPTYGMRLHPQPQPHQAGQQPNPYGQLLNPPFLAPFPPAPHAPAPAGPAYPPPLLPPPPPFPFPFPIATQPLPVPAAPAPAPAPATQHPIYTAHSPPPIPQLAGVPRPSLRQLARNWPERDDRMVFVCTLCEADAAAQDVRRKNKKDLVRHFREAHLPSLPGGAGAAGGDYAWLGHMRWERR